VVFIQNYITGRDNMKFSFDLFLAIILFLIALIVLTIVGVIPALLLRLFGLKRAKNWWMHIFAVLYSKFIIWILHLDVHLSGNVDLCRKKGRYCFIANHTSFVDIPVIVGALKIWGGFICKKELKAVPLVNLWIFAMNSVYIFRSDIKASKKSLEKGAAKITAGIPMCVFPEGTRSKTGNIAPFKGGSFRMATKSEATVIPITIVGVRQSLEAKTTCFKKLPCYVHVGEPVDFKGLDRNQRIDAQDKIEKEINENYIKLTGRLNEIS